MADTSTHVEFAAEILSAYVSNNAVQPSELPKLFAEIHGALIGLPQAPLPDAVREPPKPAVSPKKSITSDFLICLEDGRQFRSLKRHLRTSYNMSPQEYRDKWKLPSDYPMVAPAYAKARSLLAKKMGLGRKPAVPGKVGRR